MSIDLNTQNQESATRCHDCINFDPTQLFYLLYLYQKGVQELPLNIAENLCSDPSGALYLQLVSLLGLLSINNEELTIAGECRFYLPVQSANETLTEQMYNGGIDRYELRGGFPDYTDL